MRLNLAARAGRWSAAHWKTATFGWLAFVVAAVAIGSVVGTRKLADSEGIPGESGRMEKILADDFKRPAGETVLIQSRSLTTKSPAFAAAIDDITHRVSSVPAVTHVRSPLEPANADQISADEHSAIVRFDIRGEPDKAVDKIDPVLAAVKNAQAQHPGFFIGGFGAATADKGISDVVAKDFERAGVLSVTIVILVVAFGARCRGHPVAARPLRRPGDARTAGDSEPRVAGGRQHQRRGLVDRPRGWRRLLALLSEARTRGARCGTQRGSRANGCRRHFGPSRARLGTDGAGRDGRDARHRRQDVRLLRHRDDDGRCDRRVGFAHRSPGIAVAAW
jgi:hypothetical protein